MNPGVTISPVASITRDASPLSPRPTAAIRSPSTATSAATPGAPLPSITVPPLMRSDQAIGLLGDVDDLHGLHLVALLDAVHDVHARGDLAEDGVLAVEKMRGSEGDVELAPCGVGILAACHGHHPTIVLLLVELGLDLVARPARAVALGITALHHESGLHAMEGEPVVEALLGEGDEVLDRLGRIGGEEFDLDDAALFHGDLGDLFHASGSFLRLSGLGSLGPRAGRHDERDHESGQQRSDVHVCAPPRAGGRRPLCPPRWPGARATQRGIEKFRARVDTCRSAATSATSPSSRTSTTARPPSWTPCCGSRASSAPTSTWPSGSWTRSTWSARRASPSWPRTRPSTTRT